MPLTNHLISQNLTHTLGLAILRGDFVDALPLKADIGDRFGVSRSSAREAVKMLSAKGLIRSRPKQGIRIQPERIVGKYRGIAQVD